jgi:hypothetical protein
LIEIESSLLLHVHQTSAFSTLAVQWVQKLNRNFYPLIAFSKKRGGKKVDCLEVPYVHYGQIPHHPLTRSLLHRQKMLLRSEGYREDVGILMHDDVWVGQARGGDCCMLIVEIDLGCFHYISEGVGVTENEL